MGYNMLQPVERVGSELYNPTRACTESGKALCPGQGWQRCRVQRRRNQNEASNEGTSPAVTAMTAFSALVYPDVPSSIAFPSIYEVETCRIIEKGVV